MASGSTAMALQPRTRLLAPMLASLGLLASVASADSLVDWGGPPSSRSLQAIIDISDPVAIDCGNSHVLVIKSDGTVKAWLDNTGPSGFEQPPAGLNQVVKVSAGGQHSLALRADGTVRAWGNNPSGQLDVPAGLSGVVSISAGGGHSLAAKADGTVVAWGANNEGQCNVPAGLTGVVQVSASDYFSAALKSDGTVVVWGANWYNTLGVPAGLSNVASISAGARSITALKSDGTVVAWGDNLYKQLNVPANLTGVTKISTGYDRVIALKSNGSVVCWGRNQMAQLNPPPTLRAVTDVASGGVNQSTLSWAIGKAFTVQIPRVSTIETEQTTAMVDIGDPAPAGGAEVRLSSTGNLPDGLVMPETVTVPAGQTRATFPVTTKYFFFTLTGEYQGAYASKMSRLRPLSITGATISVSFSPTSVAGGSPIDTTMRLQLSKAPVDDLRLDLFSGNPAFQAPAKVDFAPGQTIAVVPIAHSLTPTNLFCSIQAYYGPLTVVFRSVQVSAIKPTLTIPAGEIPKGEQVTGKVTLNSEVREAATITLTSSGAAASVPATVTVPAGAKEVTFPVHADKGGNTTITAAFNGNSSAVLVTVAGIGVKRVNLPALIVGQRYFTGSVELAKPAQAGGQLVNLVSLDPGLRTAVNVTVPQGQTTATFSIVSNDVATLQNATVQATTDDDSTATATMQVRPVEIHSFTISQTTIKGGESFEGTITLLDLVGVNTLVDVVSGDPAVVVVPSSTTVVKGGRVRTFTIKTKKVTAVKYVKVTVIKHGSTTYRTIKVTP
ncbi:hypothetical protein EON79_07450 [bacterium]|nr:MAG: hypothetical protein EON79_07450 [bacterium]